MSEQLNDIVRAPFSQAQVASLNTYQQSGVLHPFTCGCGARHVLYATSEGWRCPGGYTQDWAHEFMADWSWRKHESEAKHD